MPKFYTSPFRTDRSTDSTSMLIKELLHKLPNIFLTEYLSNGLLVSAPNQPSYAPVCVSVHVLGLTDRSQPIWSSACSADAADVELVSQHCANREAVGQIFREGIYLRVSVEAHLWALKYMSILLSIRMDLYKSALWAHSMYRVLFFELSFPVLLTLSLYLSRLHCILSSQINLFSLSVFCVFFRVASGRNFSQLQKING